MLRSLPLVHRLLLLASVGVVLVALLFITEQEKIPSLPFTSQSLPLPSLNESSVVQNQTPATDVPDATDGLSLVEASAEEALTEAEAPVVVELPKQYQVQPGDTLSSIFEQRSLPQATLMQIISADEGLLALEVVRPGDQLDFEMNEEGSALQRMTLVVGPGKRVEYSRIDSGDFESHEIVSPTEWKQQVVSGQVVGSFYVSAKNSGLGESEIMTIQQVLKERLNFRRDFRAGDRFSIILGREQVLDGGAPTGQVRIEGIRLHAGRVTQTAFLSEDGNYYDRDGESLARAFMRYPTAHPYRVSSGFNLKRHHPVTGRIAPHYGTDFAMPTGTPVLATGDGVVTRVAEHPYAGRYVEIKYPGQFEVRFLHLSKALVKPGQHVKRGEKIALSGNTGRSTGPHLHFEMRIGGRPVNAMTAKIPTSVKVPKDQMPAFASRVKSLLATMTDAEEQVAQDGLTPSLPRG